MDIILSCIAYVFHQQGQARTWAWIFTFPSLLQTRFPSQEHEFLQGEMGLQGKWTEASTAYSSFRSQAQF